jgi:hypothetical protein
MDAEEQAGERYWLKRIDQHASFEDRVCSGGRRDQVTRAICDDKVSIDGLPALYQAFGLQAGQTGGGEQNLAIATASSGLSFKAVSPANPRSFLMTGQSPEFSRQRAVVVAFSRGEQLVEIAALDESAAAINFYLLSYEQGCEPRCRPDQLLLAETESNWRTWRLYTDADLEDTPFDCLSCHRPGGPGTPRRLLMRDFDIPWFQWLPEARVERACTDAQGISRPPIHANSDLRTRFLRANPEGYAGLGPQAIGNADGHNLHTFVFMFGATFLQPPLDEPFVLDSRQAFDQWRCDDRNDLWKLYRKSTLEVLGTPVPYYKYDNSSASGTRALDNLRDYLARASAEVPAAEILEQFVDEEAKLATGALIADGPPEALLVMGCGRCHDARAPVGSVRSKFNINEISPASARAAAARLRLAGSSPFVMPPARAGSLAKEARDHLLAFFETAAQNP